MTAKPLTFAELDAMSKGDRIEFPEGTTVNRGKPIAYAIHAGTHNWPWELYDDTDTVATFFESAEVVARGAYLFTPDDDSIPSLSRRFTEADFAAVEPGEHAIPPEGSTGLLFAVHVARDGEVEGVVNPWFVVTTDFEDSFWSKSVYLARDGWTLPEPMTIEDHLAAARAIADATPDPEGGIKKGEEFRALWDDGSVGARYVAGNDLPVRGAGIHRILVHPRPVPRTREDVIREHVESAVRAAAEYGVEDSDYTTGISETLERLIASTTAALAALDEDGAA